MSSPQPGLEIHPGIILKGQLSMAKDVVLTGRFEGDLQTLGQLTVSAGGTAIGTIEASALVLEPGNNVEARVKITSPGIAPPRPGVSGSPDRSAKWPLSLKKLKELALGPRLMKPAHHQQQEVECPHCHETQSEPLGAISTNCKACGRYFKLGPPKEPRGTGAPRAAKSTREVFCVKCGAPNIVSTAALSTQCIRCLHYLELGDKIVRGVQTGKLYAYDDVVFAEGCSFKGMEATGRRIEVRGKVFSKLRATAEIVALAGSQLSGELHAPVIRVERDAKVKVQTIDCARLMVGGEVEVSGLLAASEIIFRDGAIFSGQLHMPEGKLEIEAGVSTQMESITCREIRVDGRVTLGNSLYAEKVSVGDGGVLTSGRINAAHIQVSPGGFLQGRIEKYSPPPAPPEPATVAEAA